MTTQTSNTIPSINLTLHHHAVCFVINRNNAPKDKFEQLLKQLDYSSEANLAIQKALKLKNGDGIAIVLYDINLSTSTAGIDFQPGEETIFAKVSEASKSFFGKLGLDVQAKRHAEELIKSTNSLMKKDQPVEVVKLMAEAQAVLAAFNKAEGKSAPATPTTPSSVRASNSENFQSPLNSPMSDGEFNRSFQLPSSPESDDDDESLKKPALKPIIVEMRKSNNEKEQFPYYFFIRTDSLLEKEMDSLCQVFELGGLKVLKIKDAKFLAVRIQKLNDKPARESGCDIFGTFKTMLSFLQTKYHVLL